MLIGKIICLFLLFSNGISTVGNVYQGNRVSLQQIHIASAAATGFIVLQWLI